ncbi:hypothetical protein C8R45DRAFT_1124309 [Mycena sanguinolenta]|nr:hypothetical protein C8R45DRAFT_1124309 [Mycena sanguinolenta]
MPIVSGNLIFIRTFFIIPSSHYSLLGLYSLRNIHDLSYILLCSVTEACYYANRYINKSYILLCSVTEATTLTPIYTLNTHGPLDTFKKEDFFKALAALHAETFHSDPAAVRVEFVVGPCEGTRFRYGGYGFKPAKGMFGSDRTTAHLVAQIIWNGSAEEWEEYCRKIAKLWGQQLRTIVLQRVEWEFEVTEEPHYVGCKCGACINGRLGGFVREGAHSA